MTIWRGATSRGATWALGLLLVLPLACGGGGGGGSSDGPASELFAGSAGELVPHETGRSARFRVTARQGGASNVSGFTATVTRNGPEGAFSTRYVSDGGATAESTAQDRDGAIAVLRFTSDPGGPAEEVTVPEPPVVVVRTPVIAGDAIETGFVRTLELEIRVGTELQRRTILFTGRARRVPEERGPVTVADGTYPDAIRYAVSASGDATIPILGQSVGLRVEVAGDEWFAIGVGGVKEELDVTVRAGDERATVAFTTEREGLPPEP